MIDIFSHEFLIIIDVLKTKIYLQFWKFLFLKFIYNFIRKGNAKQCLWKWESPSTSTSLVQEAVEFRKSYLQQEYLWRYPIKTA